MKPKVRIVYDRKKQATRSIPALIQIEVYYNVKHKYISTGIKVTIDKWDDVNKRTKGTNNDNNNNYHINNLVRKIEDFIIDCERKGEEFSFTTLDLVISGNVNSSTSFLEYMLERLGKRKLEKSTAKVLMCLCNHVEKFGRLKTFADLTQTNIKEFDYYLSQCGMSPVTVAKRHKQLGSFINEAIIDGFVKTSPYATLKLQKGKSKEPVFLLENEIQMIANFETENRTIQKVKDVFLFQCFSGLAYSDVRKFTKDDVRELDGKKIISSNRQKTDESFISLLLPDAERILVKYDYTLPVLSNQKYNSYLKDLAKNVGINKKLTSHTARHSYATYLLNKGISISTVSRAIGHSNTRMTEHYARLLGKTVINEMSILL